MEVSFSCVKNSVTDSCLMRYDTVENESSISNRIQYKPLCSSSRTARQTEAQGPMKKVQVRLQGHTVCNRYLREGATLPTPYPSSYKQSRQERVRAHV
jgi:hypothetical protein